MRRILSPLLTVFLLATTAACGPKPPIAPPSGFGGGLQKEGSSSWLRLPFPDSKFEPGAVIIIEGKDPRWIGHIRDCGVAEDVLAPAAGSIGDLTFNSSRTWSADAVLKIQGIKAGPEFSRVRSVGFVQNGMTADALNLIRLQLWLNEPANQAKVAACDSILSRPEAYILGETIRVNDGKYTLTAADGSKIGIEGIKIGVVEFEPNAEVKADATGDLVITKPVYTHIRRVKRVDKNTLIVLSNSASMSFDDEELLAKAGVAGQ